MLIGARRETLDGGSCCARDDSAAPAAIVALANTGTIPGGFGGVDTLIGIENFVESAFNDIRVGNAADMSLTSAPALTACRAERAYDNRMVFLRACRGAAAVSKSSIGSDKDDDPARFSERHGDIRRNRRATASIRHVLTGISGANCSACGADLSSVTPADVYSRFGAVELGYQTLGKLAKHVGAN